MNVTHVRSIPAQWWLYVLCFAALACADTPADRQVRCGAGTVLVGGECRAIDAGTPQDAVNKDAGQQQPTDAGMAPVCPEGSIPWAGQCLSLPPTAADAGVLHVSCGPGTREVDGACVRLDCYTHDDCSEDALCVSNRCQKLGTCHAQADCHDGGQRCVSGRCRSSCPSSAASACADLHAGWRCVESVCAPAGALPGAPCLAADGCEPALAGERALPASCVDGVCRITCDDASQCAAWSAELTCSMNGLCLPRGSALGGACTADGQCGPDLQHKPVWPLRCVQGSCVVDCSPQAGPSPGYGAALCPTLGQDYRCSQSKGFICAHEPGPAPGPIAAENALPGAVDWQLTSPATAREIEGYAGQTSVNRGEDIELFVSTSASTYRIDVYRLGYYAGLGARRVAGPVTRTGSLQVTPQADAEGMIDCGWTDPYVLHTSAQWTSGIYLARLTTDDTGKQSFIAFVVRDDARASDYLFQSSVTTHQAYNNWGGKSLYDFNSVGNQRAHKVSFNRPFALGLNPADAALGLGAGEVLTNFQAITETRASAWEYPMLRFLEREGYDLTYATNIDMHRDPQLLASHKALLSVGHDEYWSYRMRSHAELARDRWGTHLGFFSGNDCYWQVRLESDAQSHPYRTLVVYKDETLDPLAGSADAHLLTTRWALAPLRYSEVGLVGVHFAEAGVHDDLVVDDDSSWALTGTGLRHGDHVPGLLGYEVDAVGGPLPAGVTRIMQSPWATTSTSGLADMITSQAASGAITFAAGSIQFSWGLDDFGQHDWPRSVVSPAMQQLTRNVLARFQMRDAPATEQVLLRDDFSAGTRDGSRWILGVSTESASSLDANVQTAQDGRLVITPRERLTGLHHNGYLSARTWDMTNAVARVELLQVPRAATSADTTFALVQDGDHWVRFTQEEDALIMQLKSGSQLTRHSVVYDSVQQRVLRFRHAPDSSEFLWESSSDGQAFVTLWRTTHDFPVSAMRVELEAGTYQSAAGIGVAMFDNFELTQSGFSDSFDGYRQPDYWTPGVVSEGADRYALSWLPIHSNGTLRLRPSDPDGTLRGTGYVSTRTWDVTGGEARIEQSNTLNVGASSVFALTLDAKNWVRLRVQAGQLQCQDSVSGDIRASEVPYDANAQRFMRIAHHTDTNTFTCETSPDGQSWTVLRALTAAFALNALHVELALYAEQPSAAGSEARFEQLRLRTALAP